jgi:hypothetical protein
MFLRNVGIDCVTTQKMNIDSLGPVRLGWSRGCGKEEKDIETKSEMIVLFELDLFLILLIFSLRHCLSACESSSFVPNLGCNADE